MTALTFSDVLIIPKYSNVTSRKLVNITSDLLYFKLSIPVISANMKTITGPKMAVTMCENGGMGILHRFCSIEQAVNDYIETKKNIDKNNYTPNIGVSIGVQDEDKKRFEMLSNAGAKIFAIDVAHGHSIMVKKMLTWLKTQKDSNMCFIAGNIATGNAAYDLIDWGADIVKVGIGPGHCCTTRKATGVGVPQLHAVQDVYQTLSEQGLRKKARIILDGGIEMVGDICKALKYADAVMLGNFLSGTSETPGDVFRDENNNFYKVYAGSASGENKSENGDPTEFIEGITKKVPFRGHVKHIIREIEYGIRSAFSYVGAFNMEEYKTKCEFIEISNGGKLESKF